MADKLKPKNYPENPKTIGEHLRRVRIDKNLLQREVADIIEVDTATIENWEKGKAKPQPKFHLQIIDFLGYAPESLGDNTKLNNPLFLYRMKNDLTQKQLAKMLEIDKSTIQANEAGMRPMIERTKRKLKKHGII